MSSQMRRIAVLLVTLAALVLLVAMTMPGAATGAPLPKFKEVTVEGTLVNGDLRQLIASCGEGYHVTGGGYQFASINPALFVHQEIPLNPEINDGEWGWAVTALNETGVSVSWLVIALCTKD